MLNDRIALVRNCTICCARESRQTEAVYVATLPAPEGGDDLEWFECHEHAPEDHGLFFGLDTSQRTVAPLAEWLEKKLGLA